MKGRGILFIIVIVILISGCKTQEIKVKEECQCNKLVKEYNYFYKVIVDENYGSFPPQKPLVTYADGTSSNPPINKHVKIMLDCIPVQLDAPTGELVYKIYRDKLDKWKIWLVVNCKKEYDSKAVTD